MEIESSLHLQAQPQRPPVSFQEKSAPPYKGTQHKNGTRPLESVDEKIPATSAGTKLQNKENLRCANCSPQVWWTIRDSNPGPTGYEPAALTNCANGPY